MLNLLTKTKPWMVASFLVATAAFGQQQNPAPAISMPKAESKAVCCDFMNECPTIAAYNFPARRDTRCSWDVWGDASFIYWQAILENIEPAFVATSVADPHLGGLNDARVWNMDFQYKPGFKVGVGMSFDHDDWDAAIEYTRFTSKVQRKSSTDFAFTPLLVDPTSTFYLTQDFDYAAGDSIDFYKANWRLSMNIADALVGRSYYVGRRLTVHPTFGARAAWIEQKIHAYYQADDVNGELIGTINGKAKTRNWAIGPRAALQTNWMVGYGLRFFGSSGLDLLYTRNRYKGDVVVVNNRDVLNWESKLKNHAINTVRTHFDLDMGIGYGTYFDCNNWYFDVSASYGFQAFLDQNEFRFFSGIFSSNSVAPNGNLYIHGLTATMKLDF